MTAPITAEEARPIALRLIGELGQNIGNPKAISDLLIGTLDTHGPDAHRVLIAALGLTYAEHVTRDPDEASAHQKRHKRPTRRKNRS